MHHGPFPEGLSLEEHSRIRVEYLSGEALAEHEKRHGKSRHDFSERDETLARFQQNNEVILWFEHDLLDQLQILQLLGWFAQVDLCQTNLSMICINQFDGIPNFRGIGQLSPAQMSSLFARREKVRDKHFDTACKCWDAFCSAEPTALAGLLESSVVDIDDVLPFLAAALLRHCQEFPWVTDGLSRTERQLLNLVDAGVTHPHRIFSDNMNFETCLYIGDWRTYAQLSDLCEAETPLLAREGGQPFLYQANSSIRSAGFEQQELTLTSYGKAVLNGDTKANLNRDCWLGGVNLNSEKNLWHWDDETSKFHKTTAL